MKPLLIGLLLLILPGAARAQGCPSPATDEQVAAQAEAAAEAFFVTADKAQFEAAVANMRAQLACLAEPISPETAASLHLAGALEALVEGRDRAIALSLHAARSTSPAFSLTEEQAPNGNPLRVALEDAEGMVLSDSTPVPRPECVSLHVDGHQSEGWISERPAVVQLIAPDGEVLSSHYLEPGAVPPTTSYTCPQRRVGDAGEGPSSSTGRRVLIGSGAALAAGSAGAFALLASRAKTEWSSTAALIEADDPSILDPSPEEVTRFSETLPARANGFSAAALGAGAVAVGLGATLVVTW